jgi:hypothetical protein
MFTKNAGFYELGKKLKNIGICLYDENGDVRSVHPILSEMSAVWNSITKQQQDDITAEISKINRGVL